jgi:hypothetical protein
MKLHPIVVITYDDLVILNVQCFTNDPCGRVEAVQAVRTIIRHECHEELHDEEFGESGEFHFWKVIGGHHFSLSMIETPYGAGGRNEEGIAE